MSAYPPSNEIASALRPTSVARALTDVLNARATNITNALMVAVEPHQMYAMQGRLHELHEIRKMLQPTPPRLGDT